MFRKAGATSGSLATLAVCGQARLPSSAGHSTSTNSSIHSHPSNVLSLHELCHPTVAARPRFDFACFDLNCLSSPPLVNMGAIPEADPDEPVETKPFKFVTGEPLFTDPRLHARA